MYNWGFYCHGDKCANIRLGFLIKFVLSHLNALQLRSPAVPSWSAMCTALFVWPCSRSAASLGRHTPHPRVPPRKKMSRDSKNPENTMSYMMISGMVLFTVSMLCRCTGTLFQGYRGGIRVPCLTFDSEHNAVRQTPFQNWQLFGSPDNCMRELDSIIAGCMALVIPIPIIAIVLVIGLCLEVSSIKSEWDKWGKMEGMVLALYAKGTFKQN